MQSSIGNCKSPSCTTLWPGKKHTTRYTSQKTGARLLGMLRRQPRVPIRTHSEYWPTSCRLQLLLHLLNHALRRREQTQAKNFKDIWGFLVSPGPPTSVSFTLQASSVKLSNTQIGLVDAADTTSCSEDSQVHQSSRWYLDCGCSTNTGTKYG